MGLFGYIHRTEMKSGDAAWLSVIAPRKFSPKWLAAHGKTKGTWEGDANSRALSHAYSAELGDLQMVRTWGFIGSLAFALGMGALSAAPAAAIPISFGCITNNSATDCAIGEAQFTVEATDLGGVEPSAVAKTLKALVEKENPDLVIMGKQAIDDDSNQT